MMRHFILQELPWPDCIMPLQGPFAKRIFQESTASLLAMSSAEILSIPLVKKVSAIEDKKVLLIGERIDAEFFSAGEALIEGCPHSIMGAALFI